MLSQPHLRALVLRVDLRVDRVAVLSPPSSFSSGLADAAARVILRDDAVLSPSPSFLEALLVLLREATLPLSSLLTALRAPLRAFFFFATAVVSGSLPGTAPSPSTSPFSRLPSSGTFEWHEDRDASIHARGSAGRHKVRKETHPRQGLLLHRSPSRSP